jgi:hypothetical protein
MNKIIKIVKKIVPASLILLLMSFDQCSRNYGYDELPSLLERANLILVLPKDYSMVPIIQNSQVKYDIAYRLANSIEVRCSIRPYDSQLVRYNAYLERKAKGIKPVHPEKGEYDEFMADPSGMYKAMFTSIIYNISAKSDTSMNTIMKTTKEYKTEDIQYDFNADYGAFTNCDLDKEFGQNYKKCFTYMIHKEKLAMVVFFLLYEDENQMKEFLTNKELVTAFNCIQFYKAQPPKQLHPKGINRIFLSE